MNASGRVGRAWSVNVYGGLAPTGGDERSNSDMKCSGGRVKRLVGGGGGCVCAAARNLNSSTFIMISSEPLPWKPSRVHLRRLSHSSGVTHLFFFLFFFESTRKPAPSSSEPPLIEVEADSQSFSGHEIATVKGAAAHE